MGKYRNVSRTTNKATGVKTTTTSKRNSPGKITTTRTFESAGTRYSYNMNTGKTRKTKLW